MWANLRKFTLANHSFPIILDNVALLLRTLTINIYKNDDKNAPWLFYVTTTIGSMCYFYFYVFSMIWLVCFRYTIPKDFVAIALAISLTTASFTSISNLIFMKLRESRTQDIINKYLAFDAQIVLGTRFEINLRQYLRVVKRRALVIWIFLFTDALVYIVIPFFRPGRHFTEDKYMIYGFEPAFESPNYEIILALNVISVWHCAYIMVNIAAFNIVVIGYSEAQLHAISDEIKYLWDDGQNYYTIVKHRIYNKVDVINIKNKIVNEYIRIHLKSIIYNHVTNINLFKEFINLQSDSLTIEYGIMCIAIITELLGGLENTYLQLPFTLVLISIDCLSGQRIIDACDELENSLNTCEWENFNVSNQKTIHLMLVLSQKTLMVSPGGMTKLNFNCLMMILKSSYSAYTTLKSSVHHE